MVTVAVNSEATLAIFKDEHNVSPYAVMQWNERGNFWQQVSPWYYRKGNAVNKYNALNKEG